VSPRVRATNAAVLSDPLACAVDLGLPLDDPSVEELPVPLRRLLSQSWQRRAKSELEVGFAFEALSARAQQLGVDPAVCTLLRRASAQERTHSLICRAMAERYGARRIDDPDLSGFALPEFGEPEPRLEFTLHLTGLCCVNETLASAWIHACVAASRTRLGLAANRAHLREEIEHARIGWAHLASCMRDEQLLAGLRRRLPELLRVNVRQWLDPALYVDGPGLSEHGVLGSVESRRTILAAVDELVLPGFAHLGIDVPPLDWQH